MAERVEFDMDEIRQFGRSIEDFTQNAEDIVQRMNASLNTVRETWQDRQLDKPSMNILDANARIMRTVNDLYPLVQDFLRRQEQWHDEYVSI